MIPYFFFLFAAPCLGETLPDRGRHPFDNAIPFSCVPPSYRIPCRALAFPPRFLYNKEAAIFSIVSVIFFSTFQKDTMKARRIWYAKPCSVSRVPSLSGGNYLDPDQRQMEGSDPARPDAGHQTLWGAEKVLRQMEASGLLTRTVYAEVPPRVEYTLTDLGRSLRPVLDAMEAWGKAYQENAR